MACKWQLRVVNYTQITQCIALSNAHSITAIKNYVATAITDELTQTPNNIQKYRHITLHESIDHL